MRVHVQSVGPILLMQAPLMAIAGDAAPAAPAAQVPQIHVAGTLSDTDARRGFVAGKIVIGRKRIAESGLRKVDDLLRREPAVTVSSDGRIGLLNLPGYTQVLIDGRPPVGKSAGELDLVHVERIEIVKGSVAEFGAFSIAGTINIVTRTVARNTATEFSAGLESQSGKVGAETSLSHNVGTSGTPVRYSFELSADTNGSVAESTLWQAVTGPGAPETASELWRGKMHSTSRSRSAHLGGTLIWQLSEHRSVQIAPRIEGYRDKGSFSEGRLWRDGASWLAGEASSNSRDSIAVPITWTFKPGPSSHVEVSAFAVHLRSRTLEDRIDAGSVVRQIGQTDSNIDAATRSLEVTYKKRLANGHDVKAGTRYFRQKFSLTHANFSDGFAHPFMQALGTSSYSLSRQTRFYVQDEWHLNNKVAINAGLAGENRQSDLSAGAVSGSNSFRLWAPSLHISRKIANDEKRQVRLSLSRSYKAPEDTALGLRASINSWAPCSPVTGCGRNSLDTPDRVGSVTLRPERALSVDLSYERGFGDDSQVTFALFSRRIDEKFGEETVLSAVPWAIVPRYVVRPVNLGQAQSFGASIEMNVALPDLYEDAPRLTVRGSINLAKSKVSSIPGPDNRLDKQSPRSAKVGATYEFSAWPLTVDVDGQWTPSFASRTSITDRVVASRKFTLETSAQWKVVKGQRVVMSWSTSYPGWLTTLDQTISADRITDFYDRMPAISRFQLQFETTL